MRIVQICLFVFLLFSLGCGTTKIAKAPEITDEVLLETLEVTAKPISDDNKYSIPAYQPSELRLFDLIHTKLDLSFEMPNEIVKGKAWLTLSPLFYPQTEIRIDAVNFDVHSIKNARNNQTLDFQYDDREMIISIDEATKADTLEIYIEYTAHPSKNASKLMGAITGNQGLYFIDPKENDPDLPTQIWSQGETENNSRWFPTFDQPNENSTQEMILTVEEKYKTLSNGLLIRSENNINGTRTDHWKMSDPHAPYLFMIAIGDFAVVEDVWRGKPIQYFVDPEYAESASMIFNHTPEMLDFFSDRFGLEYPWEKYSQIIANEFVSGAMENTTAVIFGDFIQAHKEDFLVESENDYIVAHEMIHHWFGDYVTCESWANLTLNEGFANYGEYLWFEYKYGKEEADYSRYFELLGYYREASVRKHPLIYYGYDDKDEMFDAHSYNKGGLVLHMLRNYIGDDAFFQASNLYLTRNAHQSVEVHDLRLAFEDVTGQDLSWFFDQWYLQAGHPIVQESHVYLAELKKLEMTFAQEQYPEESPAIFQLPLSIDIYLANGKIQREMVFLNKRAQKFEIAVESEPVLVISNADDVALGYIKSSFSLAENELKLEKAASMRHRMEALNDLIAEKSLSEKAIKIGLKDSFWAIRNNILEAIDLSKHKSLQDQVAKMATEDPDPRVRIAALDAISVVKHPQTALIADQFLSSSKKTETVFAAIAALIEIDPKAAREAVKKYQIVLPE